MDNELKTGQIYSGLVINSGYGLVVESGEIAQSTIVNSGGIVRVLSGGGAIDTLINPGGLYEVYSGGAANLTLLVGVESGYGVQAIYSGGEAYRTYMSGGGLQVVFSGAYASGTELLYGGQQTIHAGATAENTIVGGAGIQALYMNPAVGSGMFAGSLNSEIRSGGAQIFLAANSSDYVDLAAVGTRVLAGGAQYLGYYDYSKQAWIYVGGVSISGFLLGGEQHIPYRGVALDSVIDSGGGQYIYYGGLASGTLINSGRQSIFEGGAAVGTIIGKNGVASDGFQLVSSSGVAYDTLLNGGMQNVLFGGSALLTALVNGGTQNVSSGGIASNTMIYSGGSAKIVAGASLTNAYVGLGGELVIEGAAGFSGDLLVANGKVTISDSATITSARVVADITGIVGLSQSHEAYADYNAPVLEWINAYDKMSFGIAVAADQKTGLYSICDKAVNPSSGISIFIGAEENKLKFNEVLTLGSYSYVLLERKNIYLTTFISYGAQVSVTYNGGEIQLLSVKHQSYSGMVIDASCEVYNELYYGCTASGTRIIADDKGLYVNKGAISYATDIKYGGEYVTGGEAHGSIIREGGIQMVMYGGISRDATVYGKLSTEDYRNGEAAVISGAKICSGGEMSVEGVNALILDTVVSSGGKMTMGADTAFGGIVRIFGGGVLNAGANVANNGVVLIALEGSTAVAAVENYDNISGGTLAVNGDEAKAGFYTIAKGVGTKLAELSLIAGGATPVELTAGVEYVNGNESYTFNVTNGEIQLSVVGKYTSLYGSANGDDAILSVENSKVKSIIAGTNKDVKGSVTANISLIGVNPCNIYGGGNMVNVGKNISLSVNTGEYTGIIYGGSRAAGGSVGVGGDIVVNINSIVHYDNVKILALGNSAWVVGGGLSDNAGALAVNGTVSTVVSGANLGQIVGGAQAMGMGTSAIVGAASMTISDTNISGDVFGGGYAYDHGVSTVAGNSLIMINSTLGMVSVAGNIYGGGANPSNSIKGGSSIIQGNSIVRFTGSGDNLSVGTVSGDGKVIGTVRGEKIIEFIDFTGEFSGNVVNFDTAGFGGSTSVSIGGFSTDNLSFDLSDRVDNQAVFVDAGNFSFSGDGNIKLNIDIADFSDSKTFALLSSNDPDIFDGVRVELWNNAQELLGFFAVGENFEWKNGEFSITNSDSLVLSFITK